MTEITKELLLRQNKALAIENEKLRQRCGSLESRMSAVENNQHLNDPEARQDMRELLTYLKETSRRQSGTFSED